MGNTNQQVTGTPQVNPQPNPPAIKDAAIHWKKIPTQTIPEIIRGEAERENTSTPKPSSTIK